MPELQITTPAKGEACLLTLLLEEILPRYLTNPIVARALDLSRPVLAVKGGTSTATVRFGDGRVVIENGLAADAWVRVDGDVDSLLAVATFEDPVMPLLRRRIGIRLSSGVLTSLLRRSGARDGATL
ncbi:MAG: hypothetical protein U0U69_16565 [Acidimicrobiia bacterium]